MEQNIRVIVFCCNWSVYPGLQLSALSRENKKTFGIIVTMCVGRIEMELILEAFYRGAWGVMIAGCPPDECEHDGNYKLRRRILLIKNLLKQFNIEPERIALEWVSTGESAKLQQMINTLVDKVTELGPIR